MSRMFQKSSSITALVATLNLAMKFKPCSVLDSRSSERMKANEFGWVFLLSVFCGLPLLFSDIRRRIHSVHSVGNWQKATRRKQKRDHALIVACTNNKTHKDTRATIFMAQVSLVNRSQSGHLASSESQI